MINRMDNICEAVLKGKWPVNRRYIFDFPSNLTPGHSSAAATVAESPLQRQSQAELTMAGIHTLYSTSEDKTLSPQVHVSFTSLLIPEESRQSEEDMRVMNLSSRRTL